MRGHETTADEEQKEQNEEKKSISPSQRVSSFESQFSRLPNSAEFCPKSMFGVAWSGLEPRGAATQILGGEEEAGRR